MKHPQSVEFFEAPAEEASIVSIIKIIGGGGTPDRSPLVGSESSQSLALFTFEAG